MNIQNGTVTWFSDAKGFGFISSDDKDYFVHFKDISCSGFKTLEKGAPVTFSPDKSPKGLVAKNVQVKAD